MQWGILATGNIARAFAQGLGHSHTGKLVAVGSRTKTSAETFGREFGLPSEARHGSYEDLLADPTVQAIYISNPHPGHAEWAIKCAEAGKHILCEKPLAMNHAEAMAVVEAARRHDVFLMEAFMYSCHPQTAKVAELICEGTIGAVRVIQATFSFHTKADASSRLIDPALGGGGILDVGCYPVSMSRLVAGAAAGGAPANPTAFQAVGQLGVTGVDEYTAAVALFPGGIVAQLACGVRVTQENVVRIYGEDGHIFLPTPWAPSRDGGPSKIVVRRHDEAEEREIVLEPSGPAKSYLYTIEADHVAAHIAERQSPAMSWADSLGNMRTLDQWREAIGLTYPLERPDAPAAGLTVARRPLARRENSMMKYGNVQGLDKPVSRLIIGCDNQRTYAHAAAVFDGFGEAGGNCFDTAFGYGGGEPERLLGQWLKNRAGLRDELVVVVKGAHTPNCDPASLTSQLRASLERLALDHADLYLLHRDNLAVPVGEFVDVLNEHHAAGRIRAFGGSNWSVARVQEANEYAAARGLQGFTAVSNNFSLARMVAPVWSGCVSASDAESRAWLARERVALLAWSSQARGFFLPQPPPRIGNSPTEDEIVRCWHSEDNFQRRERTLLLAKERGVEAINVALAYVLAQPFPTFALIGPRTLEEIRTSLPGLTVELTPGEVAWLNLERNAR